jgi:hypothetical protein
MRNKRYQYSNISSSINKINQKSMVNNSKEILRTTEQKLIKVQLDAKTFLTIHDTESLKIWLQRYPNAKIMAA